MSRTEYQNETLKTYGAAPEEICFYLLGAGGAGAAPTFGGGCPAGMVGTITRSSAGKYTVPLTIPVFEVTAHNVSIDDVASPDFSSGSIGPFTNEGTASGLSFTLNTVTNGSATDMGSGRKIRIRLRVKKSNWGNMK